MDDYIEKKFIKFKRARSNVQIDCYHNCSPGQEFHVEEIVREVSKSVKCSSVLAMVSRFVADLNSEVDDKNRAAISEYREILKNNFERRNVSKPYLLIVIHGMKNREGARNSVPSKMGTSVPSLSGKDIEIGTRGGKLAGSKITEWFIGKMREKFSDMKIVVDEEFSGSETLENHRKLFGENLNIFQVELSLDVREKFRERLIEEFSEILLGFKVN